jgi:hypothetical protein
MSARYTGGLVYNAPGGWSGYFDGSGDTVSAASNTSLIFGTGDFTVECWINSGSQPGSYNTFIGGDTTGSFLFSLSGSGTSTALYINAYGSAGIYNQSITFAQGTWFHIAATRSGTSLRIFVNGIQLGATVTDSTNFSAATRIVGGAGTANQNFNGYISNVRIVKGTAVYTSNFIPPVGALLPITNTSLLTCAYPTFRDGSSNNFTLTATGNASVSNVNPFPTSQLPNPALGGAGNGVYTMSQYAALKAANLWPAYDPYYSNVTLNLHGNGTNAAQNNTFLDSSTNNLTITRYGNTTQGTFTPYGSNWSNYFGGDGNYLTIPYNTAFNFGTGDFCIESFVYAIDAGRSADAGKYGTVLSGGLGASLTDFWGMYFRIVSGVITEFGTELNGTAPITATGLSYATNAWHHFVLCRTGTTLSAYIDGTRVGTATYSSNVNTNSSGSVFVGRYAYGSPYQNWVNGYFSNARIVKGSSPYNATSATLTIPTTPLTAISGTSLLTCADNRFIDDSTNNFAITVNGTSSVQRFSPFSPATAYSASVIGGSAYFDGSGDYLTAPDVSALQFGTGSFTIETWAYFPSLAVAVIFDQRASGPSSNAFVIYADTSGYLTYYSFSPSLSYTSNLQVKASSWNHIAFVRSGNAGTFYLNGVASSSTVNLSSYNNTSSANRIFQAFDPAYSTGYCSDFRIVKGTAVYTTNFTPNTTPLTAISGTSLLLNNTNAGILDNAMMNNLETVGNAQLSTSVKKYGSASIYCDGTGDYVVQPTNVSYGYGTGNFTIEFWLYLNNTGLQTIFSNLSSASSTNPHLYINAASIIYYTASADRITSSTLSTGIWYHIALCRASGSTRLFINGTQSGSTYADSNDYGTSAPLGIGTYWASGSPFTTLTLNGYIDDLRITKGVARYTANFTPPTSQVQDQ